MSFDDNNYDEFDDEGSLPEEANNNRTFLVAVGILGGIILISIACLVGVYLFNSNGNGNAQAAAEAGTQTARAVNNTMQQALTSTAQAAAILPTTTLTSEPTAVVNVATETATVDPAIAAALEEGTPAAATATVGAALTQAANAQLTIVPTTTGLPKTGLVEDIGVPGLAAMALAFVIVILLARRLRTAPVTHR